MHVGPEREAIIATIRGLVDDNIAFTSPELAREFTLADVAKRLDASRRSIRATFNTVADAADGVRLKKMDELFEQVVHLRKKHLRPDERFRALCDRLTEYEAYHFFLDSKPVFRAFEQRARAALAEILRDGIARGVFGVPNVEGAAKLAFDVLRVLAIEARSDDEEVSSLLLADGPPELPPTYLNHMDLLLRSWGWPVARDEGLRRDHRAHQRREAPARA